ncbi:zinc finger CCHC domain-containing protein 8 homolog [Sitophilus oryzae]|uniref:Zinc finger CCHC domain-containing protein 8 homolog n=1 Tax=Sitophilus oryzae TaxID=7048 RepID=A0A6J2Y4L6_SITOR|nr:zinc finger CCHC domain-containing protein 8 homolog [Sitophilus oryzae]
MASPRRHPRKRKTRGSDNIFEVSERDLSPEPEESLDDEPESKVLKSRDSDVADSRQNNDESNLKTLCLSPKEQNISNEIIILDDSLDVGKNCDDVIVLNDSQDDENLNKTKCNDSLDGTKEEQNSKQKEDIIVNSTETNLNETILEEGEVCESACVPLITIKFVDKSTADIYRERFCKFIESFIELEITSKDDLTINVNKDVSLDPKDWVVLDNTLGSSDKKEDLLELLSVQNQVKLNDQNETNKKRKKKKKQKDLFVVDTTPEITLHKDRLKYSAKFVIDDKPNDEESRASPIPKANSMCFNCGQQHSLIECTEPRNHQKIAANRQMFQNKNKSVRYHLGSDQRYGHLQPGQISDDLRKALGLKKNQIPSYVYQMRILGYPPGWLEDAKTSHSDLSMFDLDGKNVKNMNLPRTKATEVQATSVQEKQNLPKKLEKESKNFRLFKCHSNIFPNWSEIGECEYYRVPPFSNNHSKDKMLEFFEKQCMKEEDDCLAQDMEIDIDNTNELDDTEIRQESIDNMILQGDSDSGNVPSPSLRDLEKEKNRVLEELKKSTEVASWDLPSEENTVSSMPEKELIKTEDEVSQNEEINKEIEEESNSKTEEDDSKVNCISPVNFEIATKSVTSKIYGTPILKSTTPYNRLPNPDNFAKGVSQVIDFENLPNSTGKYEQMSGLIQKVRNTLKKINKS